MPIRRIETKPTERFTITVAEAAARLGISRASAYAAVSAGKLPAIRIGRHIFVPTIQVDRLLAGSAPNSRDEQTRPR